VIFFIIGLMSFLVEFSISINGNMEAYMAFKKGVSQRDPISPMVVGFIT